MFCKNCGNQIDDKAAVCIHCGVSVQKEADKDQQNSIAIIGFILSFFIAIAGLICSCMGLNKAKECNGKNKGFAIAGIIISAVSMIIGVIYVIFVIAVLAAI